MPPVLVRPPGQDILSRVNVDATKVTALIRATVLLALLHVAAGCCIPQPPGWGVGFRGTGDNLHGDGQAHALDTQEHSSPIPMPVVNCSFGSGRVETPGDNGETPVIVNPRVWGTAVVLFLRLPPGPPEREVDVRLDTSRGEVEAWLVRDVFDHGVESGVSPGRFAAPLLRAAPADRGRLTGVFRMSGVVRYVASGGRVTAAEVNLTTDSTVPPYEEYAAELQRWSAFEATNPSGPASSLPAAAPSTRPVARPARLTGTFTGHWIRYCRPWPFI